MGRGARWSYFYQQGQVKPWMKSFFPVNEAPKLVQSSSGTTKKIQKLFQTLCYVFGCPVWQIVAFTFGKILSRNADLLKGKVLPLFVESWGLWKSCRVLHILTAVVDFFVQDIWLVKVKGFGIFNLNLELESKQSVKYITP